MTSSGTRIGVLAGWFVAGFAIVLLHLWLVMVHDHDDWARRSAENRWDFRSVPSQRGSLLDRRGRVLAHDEPSMALSIHYEQFRRFHPVGAAVHGATAWVGIDGGRQGYSYLDPERGPEAAARELLDVPARALRRGALPPKVATELLRAATSVLAGCTQQPRRRVADALRAAAAGEQVIRLGDVLEVPRHVVLQAFARHKADLDALAARITAEQELLQARRGLPAERTELMELLDELREQSLAGARVTWSDSGVPRAGSLVESIWHSCAEHVSFELAAELRIERSRYPGIEVAPTVARIVSAPADSALRVLVGRVQPLDRTLASDDHDWFDRYVHRELDADWLEELVPDGLLGAPDGRIRLQGTARRSYARALLQRERRGIAGAEAAFDNSLMGRLGMRFVEHDSRRREQVLWGHLDVGSGADVRLTIDARLQHCAEVAAANIYRVEVERYSEQRDRDGVEAALAVIDALSGDVLCHAGAPVVSSAVRDLPGIVWTRSAAIGSVVKPFVLLEHLEAALAGRQHAAGDRIQDCSGSYRYGDRVLRCDHTHWAAGRDPVRAIAESCNLFFYQVGCGLGEAGVARALQRFGLRSPEEGDGFAACWQGAVPGLLPPDARPRVDPRRILPQRAIGYGVEASPLHVARAYAGLATGVLPALGIAAGVRRPGVALGVSAEVLDTVRRGLRACTRSGTARQLQLLDELQVHGKTGTAEISSRRQNNAWFAGFLPWAGQGGVQLCLCAVVYGVPSGVHGADAAGRLVVDFFAAVQADPELRHEYLVPEGVR